MTPAAETFEPIKSPFPWFGGKSRAAELIWSRLGDVPNYAEPFAGSLAVLFRRPTAPGNEIVNDLDCYVANAWRAMKHAPAEVAAACDWPVNEADLHARHRWLHARVEFRTRMENDPDYYDVRIAAWWIWGLSCWIGDNFCRPARNNSLPNIVGAKVVARKVPHLSGGQVVARKVPCLQNASKGVHRTLCGTPEGVALGAAPGGSAIAESPSEAERAGRGAESATLNQGQSDLPPEGREGRGAASAAKSSQQSAALKEWFAALSGRLRFTKVCCGDWSRVLTKASTYGQGLTGVLLDPPYDAGDSHDDVYGDLSRGVSAKVREWAIENGSNPLLRIALCGYEGEHEMPPDWECVAWKATGGYANRNAANQNARRERIWFSPACIKPEAELF